LNLKAAWFTLGTVSTNVAGDGIMELGSESPSALPSGGGSEFLPFGQHADQFQWVIDRGYSNLELNAIYGPGLGIAVVATAVNAARDVLSDPYGHFNFGSNTGSNSISDCRGNGQRHSVAQELARVLSDPLDACGRHG
jgi:hypothetical protein